MIYVVSRELENHLKIIYLPTKSFLGHYKSQLGYIFISNKFQEFSSKEIILPTFKTENFSEENFTGKLKNFTEKLKDDLDSQNFFDDQV